MANDKNRDNNKMKILKAAHPDWDWDYWVHQVK